jgi:hypothetical protein
MPDEPSVSIPTCPCELCQQAPDTDAATTHYHHSIRTFIGQLTEVQRRWYVGMLSLQPGSPPDTILAQVTGLHRQTIRRGRREVVAGLPTLPMDRQRQAGAGRPASEKKTRHWKP